MSAVISHSDLSLTCIRVSYNMYNVALWTLAGEARNEGGESEMYKRANHRAPFLQQTCGFGGNPFQKNKHPFVNMEAGFPKVHYDQHWALDGREKFMGFCIWKCFVLTRTCLVAHTWEPDRPLRQCDFVAVMTGILHSFQGDSDTEEQQMTWKLVKDLNEVCL